MKVAVLTQYFPNSHQPWGGHSAYQTMRHLTKMCEVQVFYPEASYPKHLRPSSAQHTPIDRTWNPPEVLVNYIPYSTLPVVARPVNGHRIASSLLPHISNFAPDVILNYVVYPDGYAAVKIGRALDVPVVLTAIGSDLNRIPDPLCRSLTTSALRDADFVTTVSQDLQTTARTMSNQNQIETILNGCDTSLFYPQNRIEARRAVSIPAGEIILYVGRLDYRKGLLELVEAVASLHKKRPAVHCYIVGDGPDKAKVLQAIAVHDAGKMVTLIPSAPSARIAKWMAAANVITLPSYREGCPNVILEALASGRPVVATRVGGIPELMDDTAGRLVPARDVPALTEALDTVLGLGWNSHTISAKHSRSWKDVARDLHQILLYAVDTKRAASRRIA